MNVYTVTPQELYLKSQSGPISLLDVRTPVEFQEVHAQLARNIPLDQLDAAEVAAEHNGQPLYVICRSGSRGKQAADRLAAAGVPQVFNVEGGTLAWDAAGLPVVRGKKIISLERQVRIAAGLLVLIGAILGALVHPYWIGLAGFVGAGLVFAGVTDTCGMGLLLAKMPWNRVSTASTCSTASGETKSNPPTCCG